MPQDAEGTLKTRKGKHQSSHLLWKTVAMCQAFSGQESGKFISFPELAAPDTTIKARELIISPGKTPASQAAGLGSIHWSTLAACHSSSPTKWRTESLRWDLEHKVSIAFKVHFPSSCRASLFSELWRPISCYCIKAVTIASCWQKPKHLALAAQPINPCHPKSPLPAEHQSSDTFPHPLFCIHGFIIRGKDTRNSCRLWDSIFLTPCLCQSFCWPFLFPSKQKALFLKCL